MPLMMQQGGAAEQVELLKPEQSPEKMRCRGVSHLGLSVC